MKRQLAGAASLCRRMFARVIDQDATHHLCGDGKEMYAVLPAHVPLTDEPHVGLVDESGCLQCVIGSLSSHVTVGQVMQLPMDERSQLFHCGMIAFAPG